jgi:hypothetical protein
VDTFNRKQIAKPEQWLVKAAAEIGLDYSNLSHEITNHFMNHVMNRHGQGALAITEKDFEKIPEIVRSPSLAIVGAIRERSLINAYAKMYATTTYIYFEEVLDSNRNKALRSRTFYKITKPLDMENFERIVSMNELTDSNNAKKIIATGGHPGGEA